MAKKTRATGSSGPSRPRRSPRTAAERLKPTEGHARNYCQIAAEYARGAVDDRKGKKHCKFVRQAAKRFLADLARAEKKGAPFTFQPWHGNDICDFIEQLPHVEGKWETDTIRLEPPQVFILVNVFGFRRLDGSRRFTDVYIEMARKGAKSTLTAGVSLYCLACEGEVGPQVIVAATTGEQALKVFRPAWLMVKRTAELCAAFALKCWGSQKYPRSITCDQNGGFAQAINAKSDTQDGLNPHLGVCDELHAHKVRTLYDVIKSAFGARKNPLMWCITTAGYNSMGVCYEQRTIVTNILAEVFEADHYFGIIFTLDEGDEPFEEKNWIKANPMLGVTPTFASMRDYSKIAKRSPESRGEFLTKRLNIWTTAVNGRFNLEVWKDCKAGAKIEDAKGYDVYLGVDLANTTDINSIAAVWVDAEGWLNIISRNFLPEDAVQPRTERGKEPYQIWAKDGWLETTPGNVSDHAFMEKAITDTLGTVQVKEVAFDPWQATDLCNRLTAAGAPMVEFRQGAKSYHPAIQAFERFLLAGKVRHNGSPVLTWAVGNLVVRKDPNNNEAPDKKRAAEKIDPIVSVLMAVGRAVAQKPDDTPVIGEDYELVVV